MNDFDHYFDATQRLTADLAAEKSFNEELRKRLYEGGGESDNIARDILWGTAISARDGFRRERDELAELLREIRSYAHNDHAWDAKVVRFTERHLARIDAALAKVTP